MTQFKDHFPAYQLFALLSVGLSASIFAVPASAQTWPIKQFEVVNFEPGASFSISSPGFDLVGEILRNVRSELYYPLSIDPEGYNPLSLGIFETVDLDPDTKTRIEAALGAAAIRLEAWGFPPPAAEPIVRLADGSPAYRVYLVTGLEDAAGTYRACRGEIRGETVMLLDAGEILEDGLVTNFGIEAAIHELFHAVQFNTTFAGGCSPTLPGAWIIEGQANAIGGHLAGSISEIETFEQYISLQDSAAVRDRIWGRRNYSDPLPRPYTVESDTVAYRTSSFWSFLAEYHATGGNVKTPGINDRDFSYLSDVMNSGPVARDCYGAGASCLQELAWLDARMREVFGKPLRDLYAEFMQAYGLYGVGRFTESTIPDEAWLLFSSEPKCIGNNGFTGEHEVYLRPTREELQRRIEVPRFNANSAQCWKVNPIGFDENEVMVVVTVVLQSPQPQLQLDQLTAVLADGTKRLARAEIEPPAPGDLQRVTWEFPFKVGEDQIFLLTNMNDDAEATRALTNLSISFTVIREYAFIGPAAPGLSTDDLSSLAAAIDAPLEINLVNHRAVVMRERHSRVGDSFIGIGEASGVERPCLLQISGEADRREGLPFREGIVLALRTSGPVVPDQNYPIQSSKEVRTLSDYNTGVAVATAVIAEANGQIYDFDIEHGELVFDVVTNDYIAGRLVGEGVYSEYSLQTQQYEVRKIQNVAANFGMRANAAMGRLSSNPYACLSRF